MAVHRTNNWWRFRKILWPSQNILTLLCIIYLSRKNLMISLSSRIGLDQSLARLLSSGRDLILPSLTRRPNNVQGTHSSRPARTRRGPLRPLSPNPPRNPPRSVKGAKNKNRCLDWLLKNYLFKRLRL